MLNIFVTRRHRGTFARFFSEWAPGLADLVAIHHYEEPARWPVGRPATFLFSDLERLTTDQLAIVRQFRDQLLERLPGSRIVNDPLRYLRRLPFLQALRRAGINQFDAFPISTPSGELPLPVFIRGQRDHMGPRTELLGSPTEVERGVLATLMSGLRGDELMLVEYCETRDPGGRFRKHSVFRFGDLFVNAHMLFGSNWVLKESEPLDPAMVAEQDRFVDSADRPAAILDAFELGGIDYGRIDYSLLNGNPQVWEINTNPVLLMSRDHYAEANPDVIATKERLAGRLEAGFRALATDREPLE